MTSTTRSNKHETAEDIGRGDCRIPPGLVAQAFRIDKSNLPVTGDLTAPPEVKKVLRCSCYSCHSNKVVWPWYAIVAPVSWLVAYDVHEGRKDLNFSFWSTYTQETRHHLLEEIADTITDGEMPPWYYVYPMHMEARLSSADRATLLGWISLESSTPK